MSAFHCSVCGGCVDKYCPPCKCVVERPTHRHNERAPQGEQPEAREAELREVCASLADALSGVAAGLREVGGRDEHVEPFDALVAHAREVLALRAPLPEPVPEASQGEPVAWIDAHDLRDLGAPFTNVNAWATNAVGRVPLYASPPRAEPVEPLGWVVVETRTNADGVVIHHKQVGTMFRDRQGNVPTPWTTPNGTRYTYSEEPVGIPQGGGER